MMTSKNNETGLITRKDIMKMFWRSFTIQFSWHYERQMHMGFEYMMLPTIKKLYKDDPERLKNAMQRHMEFFNTNMYISTFIGGITMAMEEMNAKDKDFDTSSISAVKVALMGPLAGIGDSLFLGTLRILAVGIGTSIAMQGSILGAILFLLVFNVPAMLVRYIGAFKGYEIGANYLNKIQESGLMEKFMYAASIIGVMVIGGMTNELVVVSTPLTIGTGEGAVAIQGVLDSLMPGMLSLAALGVYYKLLNKKVNVIVILLGTVIFGILCSWLGILG